MQSRSKNSPENHEIEHVPAFTTSRSEPFNFVFELEMRSKFSVLAPKMRTQKVGSKQPRWYHRLISRFF
jgi:hypothetical protein